MRRSRAWAGRTVCVLLYGPPSFHLSVPGRFGSGRWVGGWVHRLRKARGPVAVDRARENRPLRSTIWRTGFARKAAKSNQTESSFLAVDDPLTPAARRGGGGRRRQSSKARVRLSQRRFEWMQYEPPSSNQMSVLAPDETAIDHFVVVQIILVLCFGHVGPISFSPSRLPQSQSRKTPCSCRLSLLRLCPVPAQRGRRQSLLCLPFYLFV